MNVMTTMLFAITDPFQKLPGSGPEGVTSGSSTSPFTTEVLIIIIAVLLVLIAVLVWAIFFRKPKKILTDPLPEVAAELAKHPDYNPKKKRFRKHRREQFTHRNPTLAELKGLPPKRQEPPPAND
jgi:hypothetical protein